MLVSALLVVVGLLGAGPASADELVVDDWGRDPNVLSGSVERICGPGPRNDASSTRPGRTALMAWLSEAFPDVEGLAGFDCREIHNPRTSCPGRAKPARSSCWSTHAAGRAVDVMVGGAGNQVGPPVGKALGDEIVNFLLARVDGVDNYRVRAMGIQQLLWNGRCWNVSAHAGEGITRVGQLPGDCVDLHDNHVHITLSEAGADGLTSFYTGGEPVRDRAAVVRRDVHVLAYDAVDGRVVVRELDADGVFGEGEVSDELEPGFTSLATPDVAGNGDDEVFAYRRDTGAHVIREILDDGELGRHVEGDQVLEPGYTLVATPDVDGDGDDEVLLYDGSDGSWVLHELLQNGSLGPTLQVARASADVWFTNAATPDIDGDGDDELVLYRRWDGHHVVADFTVTSDGVELKGAAVDETEAASTDEAGADRLGAALTAGFTAMAAPDVDGDGVDELVLYREGDGCLAIRYLTDLAPDVTAGHDVDEPDVDSDVGPDESTQPCLFLGDQESDDDHEHDDHGDSLDGDTWMLESREGLEAGWTALLTASLG